MAGATRVQDFEIIFFKDDDGTEPAKSFIRELEPRMRAKMYRVAASENL